MKTKCKALMFLLLLMVVFYLSLPILSIAQVEWELVEETNLSGSISGTIKKGHIFKTSSGSIYEVVGITLQLVLELSPEVIVLKSGNLYKLIIDGFDEPLTCMQLKPPSSSIGDRISNNPHQAVLDSLLSQLTESKRELAKVASQIAPAGNGPDFIESKIDGSFKGWDGETIFKLENGQIWEQVTYAYTYHYAFRPTVYIIKVHNAYKMKVEGVSGTIFVKQLK